MRKNVKVIIYRKILFTKRKDKNEMKYGTDISISIRQKALKYYISLLNVYKDKLP